MKQNIRVIVADDHGCVRVGVRRLLEAVPHLAIVGEAPDTQTLAELLDTCPCDVVVSDIGMPDIDGARQRDVVPAAPLAAPAASARRRPDDDLPCAHAVWTAAPWCGRPSSTSAIPPTR